MLIVNNSHYHHRNYIKYLLVYINHIKNDVLCDTFGFIRRHTG